MTRVGYKEDQGPLHASVVLQSTETSSDLIFSIRQSGGGPPSIKDQALVINVLLQRVFRDHPGLTHLGVMFSDEREAFIQPLNAYLSHSPQWNSRAGRPKHGDLRSFLSETIRSEGMLAPLQNSFMQNGFSFTLDGLSRVDIEKVSSMQGGLFPVHIDAMYFKAEKLIK